MAGYIKMLHQIYQQLFLLLVHGENASVTRKLETQAETLFSFLPASKIFLSHSHPRRNYMLKYPPAILVVTEHLINENHFLCTKIPFMIVIFVFKAA